MKTVVLCFPEQVSALNTGCLKQQIKELVAEEACILALDLGDVAYMDSAGLGVLVYAFEQIRQRGGTLRVHRPSPTVRDLFYRTRFSQILEIVDRPPEALALPK